MKARARLPRPFGMEINSNTRAGKPRPYDKNWTYNVRVVFITGGTRSGKSAYALSRARMLPGKKAFIATAQALDDEMNRRIEMHKKERGIAFDTYEEHVKIADLIEALKEKYNVMLIDCLTLWLSNVMYAGVDVMQEIDRFAGAILAVIQNNNPVIRRGEVTSTLQHSSNITVSPAIFIVSNEVGMGIVPENKLARQFREYQGILNQQIAGRADEAYLMVAGIPLKIK